MVNPSQGEIGGRCDWSGNGTATPASRSKKANRAIRNPNPISANEVRTQARNVPLGRKVHPRIFDPARLPRQRFGPILHVVRRKHDPIKR